MDKVKDNKGREYSITKDGKLVNPDGSEYVVSDYSDVIRPLNDDEKGLYSSAVLYSTKMLPSFRDAVSLLRPFFDLTSQTAYTDKNARCGLGPWFFSSELDGKKRASIILHEAMHVLNDHFTRFENYGEGYSPRIMNIAGDFEINCALRDVAMVNLDFAIFPDVAPNNYPVNLLMEEYIPMLRKDEEESNKCSKCNGTGEIPDNEQKDNNSQNSNGNSQDSNDNKDNSDGSKSSDKNSTSAEQSGASGNEDAPSNSSEGKPGSGMKPCDECNGTGKKPCDGSCSSGGSGTPCPTHSEGCGSSNEGREQAADDAGIERASEAEKQISKRNTAVRISEELNKAKQAGDGHMSNFFEKIIGILKPAKVDWRTVLRQIVASTVDIATRGRQDYSYKRVNRRFANSKYIYPGMIQYEPSLMFGIDTSVSMGIADYEVTLSEVENIIKNVARGKNKLKVFTVDTEISNIQTVSSVSKLDLVGGGGTRMATAFEYINTLPRKEFPDVFALATDAELFHNDWSDIEEAIKNAPKKYTPIILITADESMKNVPDSIRQVAKIINISG